MNFKSYDGEIEIEGAIVKIKKGKKDIGRTIPLSQVISITIKKPVFTTAGCIHIQILGAKTYSSAATSVNYATDMNAIFFRKPQYEEAIKFKEALDEAISSLTNPSSDNSPNIALLKNLKELLDSGILTQEEFDTKKKQILEL